VATLFEALKQIDYPNLDLRHLCREGNPPNAVGHYEKPLDASI
jgi:hypothetical protein